MARQPQKEETRDLLGSGEGRLVSERWPTAEAGCLGSGLGAAFVDRDVSTPYLKTFFIEV